MPNTCIALSSMLLSVALGGCKRGEVTPAWIELYTGFTSPTGGMLVARVHKGAREELPQGPESTLYRIEDTLELLDADPLGEVPLTVRVGDRPLELRSNDRGYIDYSTLSGFGPPLLQIGVHIELAPGRYTADPWDGKLPVYDSEPGLAIITDIDDTLLDSDITHKVKMVENALIRSTWELIAFPDAARVLSDFSGNRPIFYISGSPWIFRERIHGYFERSRFPEGPLLLKNFSSDKIFNQELFKKKYIDFVVNALPKKKWLLFGDSGEKDPEVYATLRKEQPDRVEAIYIHLVTPQKESKDSPRFHGMTVFEKWSELAQPTASAPTVPLLGPSKSRK